MKLAFILAGTALLGACASHPGLQNYYGNAYNRDNDGIYGGNAGPFYDRDNNWRNGPQSYGSSGRFDR